MMKITEPFQKPENTLFLFHLAIRLQFLGQFGFLRERVCDFVIMFTVKLSTVFNPCSDVLSGFLSAWNERGWIVKHEGNLKSDYQIFFSVYF